MQAPVSFRWGVVVATAVALVVVWGGYAHLARAVLQDHTQATVAQAETMARGFEKSTHRAVREVDISLRNLRMELEEGGLEHAQRIVDLDLYDRNLIRRFTVFDVDGRPLFRSDGSGGGQSRCESAAFAHFKGGGADELRIG